MNPQWKHTLIGSAIGAVVAIGVVFGAAVAGYFPAPTDRQLRSYLMTHSMLAVEMLQRAQVEQSAADQKQLQAAVDKIGIKRFFDPKIAFVAGPPNAKKSVVEFFDYNCAHCRNTFPIIQKYYNAHLKDTRFAFIELPIFGEASDNAARAALAARYQPDKYVAFHFALMGSDGAVGAGEIYDAAQKVGLDINKLTADLKEPSIAKTLAAAHVLADRAGVTGTPFFVINGKAHEGEVTTQELEQLLKD